MARTGRFDPDALFELEPDEDDKDKTWLILRSKPQQAANDLRKQLKNNQRGRPQPNTAKEGTAMPSKPLTHLLNDAGERLCPYESGPALDAAAILDGTCNVKVRFCPNCARVALAPIVELVQSRCADDPLLNAILSFTTTLEEDLHILAPAPVELAVYVGKSGGAR